MQPEQIVFDSIKNYTYAIEDWDDLSGSERAIFKSIANSFAAKLLGKYTLDDLAHTTYRIYNKRFNEGAGPNWKDLDDRERTEWKEICVTITKKFNRINWSK